VNKKKKYTYKKKATGEGDLFRSIWESRERISFVTRLPLPTEEAYSYYFSHVLKKGTYPKFRLNEKNIVFMTLDEHSTWETKQYTIKDDPKWAHVFKLKEELINEYANVLSTDGPGHDAY
jgi:hypothetical protein